MAGGDVQSRAEKAIAERIIEGEADYVLASKGDRETLHQAVIAHIIERWEDDFAGVEARRHQTRGTGMGARRLGATSSCRCPRTCPGGSNGRT